MSNKAILVTYYADPPFFTRKFVNQEYCEFFNVTPKQVVGQSCLETTLLAVRAADACLGQAVRDIRDKTPFEVVSPGTGHAVRNPVAAYTQAVARVREQALGDVQRLLAVAKATGAEEAGAMAGRLEAGLPTALTGDWVWALSELDGTPWREGRRIWAERVKRMPAGDKAVLDHMLGRSPLPAKVQDIPVERLRTP